MGFAGYNFIWFVIPSASKRLPAFNVGFADNSYLVWFAVSSLSHSLAMRAIIWLLFAMFAAPSPFSHPLCRPYYFSVLALWARLCWSCSPLRFCHFILVFMSFALLGLYLPIFLFYILFAMPFVFPFGIFAYSQPYSSCFTPCPLFGLCGLSSSNLSPLFPLLFFSCHLYFLVSQVCFVWFFKSCLLIYISTALCLHHQFQFTLPVLFK